MSVDRFAARYGFARSAVTLANWRQPPFSRWSFQNLAELVPSALRQPASAEAEPAARTPELLLKNVLVAGHTATLADHLAAADCDLFCLTQGGQVLADWAAPDADPAAPHLLFSISKSVTGLVAGALQAEGLIAPEDPVTRFLPEAAASGFAGATLRNLLDMTAAVDFDEAYLAPDSAFSRYRQAMLWNPGGTGQSLRDFLCQIPPAAEPHGTAFRYRSPSSDMLGLVLERAAGARLADLLHELLWCKLGTRGPVALSLDGEGNPRAAGGLSLTARDLARLGEMMRQGGLGPKGRVLPEAWLRDTIHGGNPDQWARGDFPELLPGGAYRNQWYRSGSSWFCAIGIHGQWLLVDPPTQAVIVMLSSQAAPVDDARDQRSIALLEALLSHLR